MVQGQGRARAMGPTSRLPALESSGVVRSQQRSFVNIFGRTSGSRCVGRLCARSVGIAACSMPRSGCGIHIPAVACQPSAVPLVVKRGRIGVAASNQVVLDEYVR